jgi:branched-chain amino acid transport system permease protein
MLVKARRAGARARPANLDLRVATVGLAAAAVLPVFLGQGSEAMENLVIAAAYVIMALGLNVVVGFAGLLDLGYVAFFAIGAHVAAHFGSAFWNHTGGGHGFALFVDGPAADAPGIHLNFVIVIVLAIAATTLAGALIGLPTLRVRGDYIGIITLASGEIVTQLVNNGREIHLFGGSLTGGPAGMAAVDPVDLPFLAPFSPVDLRPWYWFALVLVGLVLFVNFRLRDSRLGRAWIALRDDEDAAAAAGVPVARTKLLAYSVGGALGGVSGAFLASYMGSVNPTQFEFSFSILILAMVVLGEVGSIWGVVLGAILVSGVNNYLLPRVLDDVPVRLGLGFDLSQISAGISVRCS